uniref:Uncharacterized protein n=1 Tax=Strongyloides venezuelensis TaxID=75913 RepID=A0A0K0EY64_STRVS
MRFIVRFVFILFLLVISLLTVILYKAYNNIHKYELKKDPVIEILARADIGEILQENDNQSKNNEIRGKFNFNKYGRRLAATNGNISNEMAIIIVIFILTIIMIFMGICCIIIVSLTHEKENNIVKHNNYKVKQIYDKEACFEKTKLFLENFKNDFESEFLPDYGYHSQVW